ncbi:MAG: kinase [Gammaproteobacteria bacterium]|nr:kinase [Gammaproteobacteria bacterium]
MSPKMDKKEFDELALARGISDPDYYGAILSITDQVTLIKETDPIIVGVSGAPGSGKSTLAAMLVNVLQQVGGFRTAVLALDDFYRTREERERMAIDIHPLFAVRGVPGTHDMALLNRVIESIRAGEVTMHPVFNKAEDDRDEEWRTVEPLDVLVLEGWCLGAIPQAESSLAIPVNELEETRDPDGRWRRRVNTELASADYQWASNCDINTFLAVPDMDSVFRWRLQQEQSLSPGARVMNEAGVREFIMYYERITRAMLKDLPGRVEITLFLDKAHCLIGHH